MKLGLHTDDVTIKPIFRIFEKSQKILKLGIAFSKTICLLAKLN